MRHVCSEEDTRALAACMESFFLKRPVRQRTASTNDGDAAQTLKSEEEIKEMDKQGDTANLHDRARRLGGKRGPKKRILGGLPEDEPAIERGRS